MRSTAKNLNPATALGEHEKAPLTVQESPHLPGRESEPESAANRTRITARIGGSSPPGLRNRIGTRKRQGRATEWRGHRWAAKEKNSLPNLPDPSLSQVVSDRQQPIGHDEDRSGNDHDCQHDPNHRL